MATGPVIDRAIGADATEIATLYLASRADALPYLQCVHSDESVHNWVRTTMLAQGQTWVVRQDGRILGFMTLDSNILNQLYLQPGQYRRGIGSMLLAKAKALSPGGLRLFTFQRNTRARAFYEARGFRVVDLNDGSRNEEGEPDVLYAWEEASLG
jgi:ribosomal protein S18 acetylase RimI-like enzyme